jgi:hypothetical protein
MKKFTFKKSVKLTAVSYVIALVAILALVNSCNKDKNISNSTIVNNAIATRIAATVPAKQGEPMTQVLTVANIHTLSNGITTNVTFNENAEVFNCQDATMLADLRKAFNSKSQVKVTFNPWQATIVNVGMPTDQEKATIGSREIINSPGTAHSVDLNSMSPDVINHIADLGAISTTSTGLTNVIPDMATAQLMFNYITEQCCALPGPYAIDYCISFQYCEDGCYARAQKMCYILNTKYHYGTHKIFSFANAGSDVLSVKAEKWGGCCVNWWYHVAPLVNIKTPTGTKAYVFDPAMFDQPVLLSAWLHAQENPACAGGSNPHVSMINIQPTPSYSPSDGTGYAFDTDPTFSSTDATLVSYAPLKTCP